MVKEKKTLSMEEKLSAILLNLQETYPDKNVRGHYMVDIAYVGDKKKWGKLVVSWDIPGVRKEQAFMLSMEHAEEEYQQLYDKAVEVLSTVSKQ